MMKSVIYIEEGPTHIARIGPSNLVKLWRAPDVVQVYHRPTTSSKAQALTGERANSIKSVPRGARLRPRESIAASLIATDGSGVQGLSYFHLMLGGKGAIAQKSPAFRMMTD